jgi:hypothetical protein
MGNAVKLSRSVIANVVKQSLFLQEIASSLMLLLRNKVLAPCQPLEAVRHSGRARRDPESRKKELDSRLRGNDGTFCFCFQA